jgi:hypothetical protein
MVQLLVTLGFVAILIGAARMIWAELARPLHLYPACADDARLDALLATRAAGRSAAILPFRRPLPAPQMPLSAAA